MMLEEIGKEYLERSKILLLRIEELKEEAKKLGPEKRRKLHNRIRSLAESAYYCKAQAEKLIDYYKRND